MVGGCLRSRNAFSRGTVTSLNVDTVACGRHRVGCASSRNMLADADKFKLVGMLAVLITFARSQVQDFDLLR